MTENETVEYFKYVSSLRKAEDYNGLFYSNTLMYGDKLALMSAEGIKKEMTLCSEYPIVIIGDNKEKFDARTWLLDSSFKKIK